MIKKISIAIVLFLFIGISFLAYDIYEDRQNEIILTGPVPVYADWNQYPISQQTPIFMLSPGTNVSVKRIRYGKDYIAILIETENDQTGWIFSGFSFELKTSSKK